MSSLFFKPWNYNAIVHENAISIFPPICVSTKRKFAHRLLKFDSPHL